MRIGMARRESAGDYQIGIYAVTRLGRGRWETRATGPGTIGDGSPRVHRTFRAAYEWCTGEPLSVTTASP